MKGLQPSGIRRRNKMIYAAVVLFLENGYEKTTTAQIARRAGMSATSARRRRCRSTSRSCLRSCASCI